MSKLSEYVQETTSELLTKVNWPTWSELQSSALIVLVSSGIIAGIVFGMDFGFQYLMEAFYNATR